MRLRASTRMSLRNQGAVSVVLMLRPQSGAAQWVAAESYEFTPATPGFEFTDIYGNLCQRILAPDGDFQIEASATVDVADELDAAPDTPPSAFDTLANDTLHFLLPSRYCESDLLGALAVEVTAGSAPGYDQVELIRNWIHKNVAYMPGSSDASTSATITARERHGVCRDMAHLGIALTRSLSIPARMVVGYLHRLEPMDQHAWFEAYVGGQWYTFDPKEEQTRPGRIILAYGRDATDVALATQFGVSELVDLSVAVERLSQR